MKNILAALVLAVFLPAVPAGAKTVGVTMGKFDDNFLTVLRNGIQRHADGLGVTLKLEDARNDVDRQIANVKGFIDAKVDAIVVASVDGDAAVAISKLASDAGIPLVYTNVEPVNADELPANQAFFASDERESGTLETREVCRRLGGKGKVVVMMGELLHYAARRRTDDVAVVLASPECKEIAVVERQSANWSRAQAEELMNQWLAAGVKFDGVIANNDEMALGAIRAMKNAGIPMNKVVVGGVDATADALAAMTLGDLDTTVFQNAAGLGVGALDAALKLAGGEPVPQKNYVPFELVTPENAERYAARN